MQSMFDIGLDAHKRKISDCVEDGGARYSPKDGGPATRFALDRSMKTPPQPWSAALEATMLSS